MTAVRHLLHDAISSPGDSHSHSSPGAIIQATEFDPLFCQNHRRGVAPNNVLEYTAEMGKDKEASWALCSVA